MIKVNLGCGYEKEPGHINIDNRLSVRPDIVADLTDGMPFKSNTADKVVAVDLLEHIPIGKTVPLIEEIYRTLKKDGIFFHATPSTDGRGAFMDPTHISFWNKASWAYYVNDDYRKLYGIKAKFDVISLEDMLTNEEYHIIHTRGVMRAIK